MKSHRRLMMASAALLCATMVAAAWCQSIAPATSPARNKSLTAQSAGVRYLACHDPSTIVQCKDEFWVFYTGAGVRSAHSKDLIHWQPGPRRGTISAPPWVASAVPNNWGNDFWAPDVMKVGDRYLLYYAVSSFGSPVSAIGLATNPTLDPADPAYRWTDRGIVVQSHRSDNFNAIDPAIARDTDGGLWLSFGSYWSGIKLIQLDPATGKRIKPDSEIYSLAHNSSIEAPYIYHHDKYYYLFVNWGRCCRGIYSTYNIRVGRSEKITGPYLDKTGKDMLNDGGSLVLGNEGQFIGPGHAGIIPANGKEWFSFHYEADARRRNTLAIRPISWDANAWPVVEQMPEETPAATSGGAR
jgi:arabinan endo-1,5-alpha-L-arabinosidase